MSKWARTTLGAILSAGGGKIQTGPFGSQLHASDYVEEGIPCIMPTNMENNKVNISNIMFISELDAGRLSQHLVQLGDIIYSRRGDVTQKALISEKEVGYFCGTGCLLVRPGAKIHPQFLTYHLSTPSNRSWIEKQAVGATMPNLNTSILSRIPLNVPDSSTQQKIAAVLSALDAKIDCNKRINAQLEALAKTLYDYWFVQFDFPDAQGRPYKSSGGKMVYNSVLKREIPEGWGDGSLWDIADFYNGLAMQNFRPSGKEYLPVIKIKEMNEGITEKTEKASASIPEAAIINDGDVLFSWSATLDVKIWSQGRGALNQHIFKVTSKEYPKTFFYFELLRYLQHFKMMADKRKTTMGHITQDHLKQSGICIPPKTLLIRAHENIDGILRQHLLLEQENQHLAHLRDWLLPMLMNGQVTVV